MKLISTTKLFGFFVVLVMLVLSVSCQKGKDAVSNAPRATDVPDEIAGTFYYGDASSTEVYSNGSWSNAVGSGQYYTFHKDGTFEFGYRNYAMVGTCSNIGAAYRKGTFTIDGNQLSLYDNYAKLTEEHSCDPSHNYDKDMEKKTEVIIVEPGQDDYGNPGIYIRSPNSNPSFFQRK
jgi:hypothetical protein